VAAAEFERGELRVFCNASHCTTAGKPPREEERKGRKEDLYPLTDGSYLNKGMDFLNPLAIVNFKKKEKQTR
jgi:hypothetical protein